MSNHPNIIDVTESTFDKDVLEQSWQVPVLVDFWAPWCGPCRTLGPILERIASDDDAFFVLAKVNVDENPSLSVRFNVRGIPAVKAFSQGEVVAEFVGVKPEPILRQFINRLRPKQEDVLLNEGVSLLATQQWGEAERAFQDVLIDYPKDGKANLGMSIALLAQGKGTEALDYLDNCTDGVELGRAQELRPLAKWLDQFGAGYDLDEEIEQVEMQYRNAARLYERGNLEASMDGLIEVLRQNKRHRKGEPRKIMVGIFSILGDQNELTNQYRQELASVLF